MPELPNAFSTSPRGSSPMRPAPVHIAEPEPPLGHSQSPRPLLRPSATFSVADVGSAAPRAPGPLGPDTVGSAAPRAPDPLDPDVAPALEQLTARLLAGLLAQERLDADARGAELSAAHDEERQQWETEGERLRAELLAARSSLQDRGEALCEATAAAASWEDRAARERQLSREELAGAEASAVQLLTSERRRVRGLEEGSAPQSQDHGIPYAVLERRYHDALEEVHGMRHAEYALSERQEAGDGDHGVRSPPGAAVAEQSAASAGGSDELQALREEHQATEEAAAAEQATVGEEVREELRGNEEQARCGEEEELQVAATEEEQLREELQVAAGAAATEEALQVAATEEELQVAATEEAKLREEFQQGLAQCREDATHGAELRAEYREAKQELQQMQEKTQLATTEMAQLREELQVVVTKEEQLREELQQRCRAHAALGAALQGEYREEKLEMQQMRQQNGEHREELQLATTETVQLREEFQVVATAEAKLREELQIAATEKAQLREEFQVAVTAKEKAQDNDQDNTALGDEATRTPPPSPPPTLEQRVQVGEGGGGQPRGELAEHRMLLLAIAKQVGAPIPSSAERRARRRAAGD